MKPSERLKKQKWERELLLRKAFIREKKPCRTCKGKGRHYPFGPSPYQGDHLCSMCLGTGWRFRGGAVPAEIHRYALGYESAHEEYLEQKSKPKRHKK